MEHPYGEQYSQEGNPRAYMTMRDYRDLPYQWQQPVERNPSEYRSMRDYRDQWMSSPYGSTYNHSWGNHTNSSWEPRPPPQYDHPEPPFYTSTSQQQQPPPLSPVEQAILNLSKQVDNFIEDNRVVNVQANQETEAVESSSNEKLDGFQSAIDRELDILQESISKLTNQFVHQEEENLEEESQEEECLTETVLVEQVQLQPQEELKVESLEAPEELQDAPVNFWPWTNEEQIRALITEESSGHETGEEPQEPIFQPIPMKLNPSATAQPKNNPTANAKTTYSPLPVYILPTPAENPKPAAPAPKGKSNPLPAAPPDSVFILPMPAAQPKPQASTTKATPSLLVLQNIRRLVASVHTFATTSKKMANAYIAWHSGWFGCGFGFGTPGPRHF